MTISRHDPALLNRTPLTPWAGPGLSPRTPVGLLLAAALATVAVTGCADDGRAVGSTPTP